jgi:hypothetical protein
MVMHDPRGGFTELRKAHDAYAAWRESVQPDRVLPVACRYTEQKVAAASRTQADSGARPAHLSRPFFSKAVLLEYAAHGQMIQ